MFSTPLTHIETTGEASAIVTPYEYGLSGGSFGELGRTQARVSMNAVGGTEHIYTPFGGYFEGDNGETIRTAGIVFNYHIPRVEFNANLLRLREVLTDVVRPQWRFVRTWRPNVSVLGQVLLQSLPTDNNIFTSDANRRAFASFSISTMARIEWDGGVISDGLQGVFSESRQPTTASIIDVVEFHEFDTLTLPDGVPLSDLLFSITVLLTAHAKGQTNRAACATSFDPDSTPIDADGRLRLMAGGLTVNTRISLA